ncbi:MauE/DoxX family redox-associated membrane protein [Sinomicrobium pectinilyticum]|uniref:MauE/DoxX family redox-associated membrane protein n=1 Tax=Sinomicrobium pectinilyticum TaxID=1084421 RepID=UPI0019D250BC|nr:MauE/DoxX family redox-associated membrane protein [Sinomicrobium pectinilyticum]
MKWLSKHQKTIVYSLSLIFAMLFVYAAVSKLLDFNTFQNQLAQSPLLSAYAGITSLMVPVSEIIIAALLCTKRFRLWGFYAFFTLMVMFTTYIFIILNFSSFTPCSCGGVLEKLGWTEHLIFNIVFILLAGFAIFLLAQNIGVPPKKIFFVLSVLTVLGIAVVTLMFLTSEKEMKRNNAFIRRYMPHPIEKLGEYDLGYNSYYIAGMDDQSIYLGNVTAPFLIKSVAHNLKDSQDHPVTIDSTEMLFKRVRIAVHPPYFYVGDGTVPVIFRGKVEDWNATTYSYDEAYFTSFVVADSTRTGFTIVSSKTGTKALALLHKAQGRDTVLLNTGILKNVLDGRFDTDGMLLWNNEHRQFIYPYYYRNRYEVIDGLLSKVFTGKTIDTINTPQIDVTYYETKDVYKRGKSVMVNRQASTYGDYLYIHSDRLGKYDSEKPLVSASIIDVYDITDNSYAFSFYLYHQPGKKLREFRVYKEFLVALVDDRLWLYKLKPKYFNPKNEKQ